MDLPQKIYLAAVVLMFLTFIVVVGFTHLSLALRKKTER